MLTGAKVVSGEVNRESRALEAEVECQHSVPEAAVTALEQLLQTVAKVRRQINPKLRIDGILLTMVDNRTNYAREVSALLRGTYGSKLKVFASDIPQSVRAAEISAEGKSIYAHDPNGKVAAAYRELTKEVLKVEKLRQKHKSDL